MKPDSKVEEELQQAEKEIQAICRKYGLVLTDSMGCYGLELISEQKHPSGDWHVVSMAFEAQYALKYPPGLVVLEMQ